MSTSTENGEGSAVSVKATTSFRELQELVGRKRPTFVKQWLEKHGILYWLNADNEPVTTTKALNDALMRGRKTEPKWNIGQNKK